MAFVSVPKDLTKVKNKIIFNLTKRQLICFGIAAAVGLPFYFLSRGIIGSSNAATGMCLLMLPAFLFAMYENEKKWFLMEHEEYGTRAAYVILSEEGTVVMNDCYNGFDEEARRNIQNFMQQQAEQAQQKQQEMQAQAQTGQTQSGETQKKKPELANWQKVMDNGEYLRSAEMAEEANYNMIDGLMNNTPKKKDKNAPRRSVLKRLRNHQKKIASQGKGQPQQQKAMEEEMERKKK